MPTDPKLKVGQPVWVKGHVLEVGLAPPGRVPECSISVSVFTPLRNVVFETVPSHIITDYPPEPSAECGWEALNDYALDGYEYRVQRRPLKPAWKPEVGEKVVFEKEEWELIGVREGTGWIERLGYTCLVPLSSLTQPKEQPE